MSKHLKQNPAIYGRSIKTPKPTYKDLEAKIGRQGEALNDMEKTINNLCREKAIKEFEVEKLNRRAKDLYDDLDAQASELSKRVHGLTALTFAVLAFAVGIVVGGNIRSRSQVTAQAETNHVEVELFTTNDAAIYGLVELDLKPTRLTNDVVFNEVSWTNCHPVPVKKTYRPNPLKKGAELLRP